ncbi:primosomal protein N' (replication factor Y) [Dysgonomonas sp. PH5-45]|uniref:replication restart helicase PriA n=1 Tax=unclassified Dysgonomonas TaxID=2630389 RepID=UPI00247437F5|nr:MULTISPECIES: primosomal protein N' [unclassified Dysgonomonas]MDH6355307.1 primosomal protein N' (replication factor Y) [Dysgonomonas sp. PH5-45]MDH6388167.1 primosomal protein N' (replication factor Y) [Dysgonomonas sp. PH5-37]
MLYADVIVPFPLQTTFTYIVPASMQGNIAVGCRVIVQFGKRKYYTAIVSKLHNKADGDGNLKEIETLLDSKPIVLPAQLQFWQWLAGYYMCAVGDVYKAALPSALKLESQTFVFRNGDYQAGQNLTQPEEKIFFALTDKKPVKIQELEKQTGIRNIMPVVKALAEKNAVFLSEDIHADYSPKTQTAVSLAKHFTDEELSEALSHLHRAKKQQSLLGDFLTLRDASANPDHFAVPKKELLQKANASVSVLDGLIQRGILRAFPSEISRFDYGNLSLNSVNSLNPHQQKAYNEIINCFNRQDTVLLHGVTSSGKTEIYIRLIKEAIGRGEQVLYLLPEIALTTQITQRLRDVFGNKLAVYHSKFTDNERGEVWQKLLADDGNAPQVVLGARSSIFLPFTRLSLVIVDEEHEASYKQQEPTPRYNARDAAIYLAYIHKAKTLLGSATPSIESYYNALNGKYGLVRLHKRHKDIELPRIEVVNTKELRRKKQMKSILSPNLVKHIELALTNREQVILFQNRRGFSPLLECKTCSWSPKCNHCDVSLTYHKGQNLLICHYCGATYSIPAECPECQTPTLEVAGYGTERIEEEVERLIPQSTVLRMDLDTTRSKHGYERIISDFSEHKADILVGTQMVAKGLDFSNVRVVGILNADAMLNYPDFRAHERAFQMITQVSGRAGRKEKQGVVVLQTSHPEHPVIADVCRNDYLSFYNTQTEERRLFRYPPFLKLIYIVLRGRDELVLQHLSEQFASALRQSFPPDNVLGPTKPPVSRVQALHIRKILIKTEATTSPKFVRDTIEYYRAALQKNAEYKNVLIHYDVDPM